MFFSKFILMLTAILLTVFSQQDVIDNSYQITAKVKTNSQAASPTEKYGYTPSHLAVKAGNLKKVKQLVEKGADVNALTIRERGGTPLHIAAETGNIPILRYLISKGAKVNPVFNIGGESPLSLALENNRDEAALFLMMKGADIRVKNHDGVSIIHKAAGLNCRGAVKIMQALIDTGVCVNTVDNQEFTPVFYVRRLDVAELLVKNGADVNHKAESGITPLFTVEDPNCVDFLASSGAVANEHNENGDTPLHQAAKMGNSVVSNKKLQKSHLYCVAIGFLWGWKVEG
ncbi:MAG: ankyrin repeat domain-containing protein [Firmicutes bacterium]|nr:ankyrin repeat domain-containing protein [Bacillota bacterium]